jgi:mono/diheme cytochrome c family protein
VEKSKSNGLTIAAAAVFTIALLGAGSAQAPAGSANTGRTGRSGTAATPDNAPTSPVTGNAIRGKELYYDYACYSCHGFTGETGARTFVPNWPVNLATETRFLTFLRGRANLAPSQPSTSMPNYAAETLTDAQAKDIYAYIRSFKQNAPPADKIPTLNAILGAAQKPYKP